MKRNTRLAAVALSTLLALSVIGPGLAVADTESPNGNLAVDASVNDGVLVTVTDDGEAAANATVNVTVDAPWSVPRSAASLGSLIVESGC